MMNEKYYYGVVMHLLLPVVKDIVKDVDQNFSDPQCNYNNWEKCYSDQMSLAFDYYNI